MTSGRLHSGPTVVVHAPGRTSRHGAAFEWVLSSALGLSWRWEDDEQAYRDADGIRMHYGADSELPGTGFNAHGLLDRVGTLTVEPPDTEGRDADGFAAVFWMASRMEEFLPQTTRDLHGRFDPVGSIPERRGWLDSPVCEDWSWRIGERLLGEAWPAHRERLMAEHAVLPTLDVDSAFAFRGKGLVRTGGAWFRDIVTTRWRRAGRRLRVASGWSSDQYDTYDSVVRQHAERGLETTWFFLLAEFGRFDRGLPPRSPALASLMRKLDASDGHSVQWHPGYAAASDSRKMASEHRAFVSILGRQPSASRQHYLRMVPSTTRRQLSELGVLDDHTEGHAARPGWRGGFARTRPWYDLEKEELTPLRLHPFAAMDATYLRYLEMAASDVPEHVGVLATESRKWGAPLRLLWHNESLSGEGQWMGWEDVYTQVLDSACG